MSRLLDQANVDRLIAAARGRVERRRELLRDQLYARGAQSRPLGFENLDSPDKVTTFTQYEARQAERERQGRIPGDINQTVVAHPAVQEMAASLPEEAV